MVYAFLVHTLASGPCHVLYSAIFANEQTVTSFEEYLTFYSLNTGADRGSLYVYFKAFFDRQLGVQLVQIDLLICSPSNWVYPFMK